MSETSGTAAAPTPARTPDSPPYAAHPAGFDADKFHTELDKALGIAADVAMPIKTPGVLREHPLGSGVKILVARCPNCKTLFGLGIDTELTGETGGKHLCRNCWKWLAVERAG